MWPFVVMFVWIPLSSSGQDNNTNGQRIIELDGDTFVAVPADMYRQIIIDQRKGFTYYSNWTVAEIQLAKCDSINTGLRIDRDRYKENWELEKSNVQDADEFNETLKSDLTGCVKEKTRLKKLIKKAPFALGLTFAAGFTVGILAK